MKILITGTAGFIGFHLAKRMAERGDEVVGIDVINDYYDINLKYARLKESGIEKSLITYNNPVVSSKYSNYIFIKLDISDKHNMEELFDTYHFDVVCNLAAQAGVRYSLTNPEAYIEANISGFLNVLECCRHTKVKHLLYASSSSVYGLNKKMPFSAHHNTDHPISLYAVTKKSNELMAHAYSHLFDIPSTGLRFFTVYGPWGRPDMALFIFTKAIMEGKPIEIFNEGKMRRDFTYIDDIVEGIIHVTDKPSKGNPDWDAKFPDPGSSKAPYQVFNIGRGAPVSLLEFIQEIERATGKLADKKYLPMQEGDVAETWADISDLENELSYTPGISVRHGVGEFINWYDNFYRFEAPKKRIRLRSSSKYNVLVTKR